MQKHWKRLVIVAVCVVVLGIAVLAGARIVDFFREAPVYGFIVGGPPPVAPADANYTFALMGDTRNNVAVLEQELGQAIAAKCAFAVFNGDLVLRPRAYHFSDFYRAVWRATAGRLPVYLVVGNHDWAGMVQDRGGVEFHRFLGPTDYVFWYGSDAFVVFSDVGQGFTPERAARLESVLSAVQTRVRNLFLVCHKPPVDPRAGMSHALSPEQGAELLKIARAHKVAVLFCSHIHGFAEKNLEGVQMVVSGGAGAQLQPGQEFHWLKVTVEGTKVTWQQVKPEGVPAGRGQGAE